MEKDVEEQGIVTPLSLNEITDSVLLRMEEIEQEKKQIEREESERRWEAGAEKRQRKRHEEAVAQCCGRLILIAWSVCWCLIGIPLVAILMYMLYLEYYQIKQQ